MASAVLGGPWGLVPNGGFSGEGGVGGQSSQTWGLAGGLTIGGGTGEQQQGRVWDGGAVIDEEMLMSAFNLLALGLQQLLRKVQLMQQQQQQVQQQQQQGWGQQQQQQQGQQQQQQQLQSRWLGSILHQLTGVEQPVAEALQPQAEVEGTPMEVEGTGTGQQGLPSQTQTQGPNPVTSNFPELLTGLPGVLSCLATCCGEQLPVLTAAASGGGGGVSGGGFSSGKPWPVLHPPAGFRGFSEEVRSCSRQLLRLGVGLLQLTQQQQQQQIQIQQHSGSGQFQQQQSATGGAGGVEQGEAGGMMYTAAAAAGGGGELNSGIAGGAGADAGVRAGVAAGTAATAAAAAAGGGGEAVGVIQGGGSSSGGADGAAKAAAKARQQAMLARMQAQQAAFQATMMDVSDDSDNDDCNGGDDNEIDNHDHKEQQGDGGGQMVSVTAGLGGQQQQQQQEEGEGGTAAAAGGKWLSVLQPPPLPQQKLVVGRLEGVPGECVVCHLRAAQSSTTTTTSQQQQQQQQGGRADVGSDPTAADYKPDCLYYLTHVQICGTMKTAMEPERPWNSPDPIPHQPQTPATAAAAATAAAPATTLDSPIAHPLSPVATAAAAPAAAATTAGATPSSPATTLDSTAASTSSPHSLRGWRNSGLQYSSVDFLPGLHVTCCGHLVHQECFKGLRQHGRGRWATHYVAGLQGELLCPLCRRLANTLMPAVTLKMNGQMLTEPTANWLALECGGDGAVAAAGCGGVTSDTTSSVLECGGDGATGAAGRGDVTGGGSAESVLCRRGTVDGGGGVGGREGGSISKLMSQGEGGCAVGDVGGIGGNGDASARAAAPAAGGKEVAAAATTGGGGGGEVAFGDAIMRGEAAAASGAGGMEARGAAGPVAATTVNSRGGMRGRSPGARVACSVSLELLRQLSHGDVSHAWQLSDKQLEVLCIEALLWRWEAIRGYVMAAREVEGMRGGEGVGVGMRGELGFSGEEVGLVQQICEVLEGLRARAEAEAAAPGALDQAAAAASDGGGGGNAGGGGGAGAGGSGASGSKPQAPDKSDVAEELHEHSQSLLGSTLDGFKPEQWAVVLAVQLPPAASAAAARNSIKEVLVMQQQQLLVPVEKPEQELRGQMAAFLEQLRASAKTPQSPTRRPWASWLPFGLRNKGGSSSSMGIGLVGEEQQQEEVGEGVQGREGGRQQQQQQGRGLEMFLMRVLVVLENHGKLMVAFERERLLIHLLLFLDGRVQQQQQEEEGEEEEGVGGRRGAGQNKQEKGGGGGEEMIWEQGEEGGEAEEAAFATPPPPPAAAAAGLAGDEAGRRGTRSAAAAAPLVQGTLAGAAAAGRSSSNLEAATAAARVMAVATELQLLPPLSREGVAEEQQQLLVSLAPGDLLREQPQGLMRRGLGRYMQMFRVFAEGLVGWGQQLRQQGEQEGRHVLTTGALQGLCADLALLQTQLLDWESSWQVLHWLRHECEQAVQTSTTSSSSQAATVRDGTAPGGFAFTPPYSPPTAAAACAVTPSPKCLNPVAPSEIKTLALHPKPALAAAAADFARAVEGLYKGLLPGKGGFGAELLVSEVPVAPALHWVLGRQLSVEVQQFVVEGWRVAAPEQDKVISKQVTTARGWEGGVPLQSHPTHF